jgi:tetratricopeptide (TPR) repeat protein/transcriptional regulator with XRE-family HTH domain
VAQRGLPFAEQLKRYRRERGLTQEQLAEQAGLSARGIRALEQGERSSPHKDTVRLLADALGLSPDQRAQFEQASIAVRSEVARPEPSAPIGAFLGAVPGGQMIGRQEEVDRLLGMMDDVEGAAGRMVLIAGEPGIGKTRLAQEVAVAARLRGFLVASGRCYEPEQSVPYYPFIDALMGVFDAAPEHVRADVPERWPYLTWLLPDRAHGVHAHELDGHDMQQRLFWAVNGFLQAVAETVPIALMLDDLHWADESSLKLLQYLARQTRGSRVFLLGTRRDVEVGRQHSLERVRRDLHREGLLNEITVRRLAQSGTAALSAAILGATEVSPEFARLVHEHTDGNPFFTQEVTRALIERGDVQVHDDQFDLQPARELEVPWGVRSAIGERVSRLSGQTQEILHEAAVLGQSFLFDDLQAMGTRTEDEVEIALEEAGGAALLRLTGDDDYSFNHALIQHALYNELSPRKRRRLHAAVGEALEQLPELVRRRRAPQIAWHFVRAGIIERALPFALVAGDKAEAVFAHAEAEQHYRAAADLAHTLGDLDREAEAFKKLGVLLRVVARYGEAQDVLEQSSSLGADESDSGGDQLTDARGWLRHAIELWPSAHYSEVLAAAERASQYADQIGNPRIQAIAETQRGMALTMIGKLEEAHRVLDGARPLFPAAGDKWWIAQYEGSTGRAYLDEGEFVQGRHYLERSQELIAGTNDRAEMAWIISSLGEVSFLIGDWVNARDRYDLAERMAREVGPDRYLSYILMHAAELDEAVGNFEEAGYHVEEGLELAQNCNAIPALRKGQSVLAEHDLLLGRPEDVVTRFQPLLESPEVDWPRAFPPPVLAEAYLQMGAVARAESLVQQRVHRFRAQNHRRALAQWLRVQGLVLKGQYQWDAAEKVFIEALELAQAMPNPYAEGRIGYELGRLYIELGRPEPARDHLERALSIFRRLDARPDGERTEYTLRSVR